MCLLRFDGAFDRLTAHISSDTGKVALLHNDDHFRRKGTGTNRSFKRGEYLDKALFSC
ncbi:MAG TPA: hypothetical protein VEL31_02080 [Ktedonobacteraceae bacterium]|nr:hypothetical protein [Ktedonobacteraceae bacterium]